MEPTLVVRHDVRVVRIDDNTHSLLAEQQLRVLALLLLGGDRP